MERELRRSQNMLVCVGTGVITFGFWSLIKGVMMLILYKDHLTELVEAAASPGVSAKTIYDIFLVLMGIMVFIDLLIRLYVGLSARKDGMEKSIRKHRGYPVFTLILAVVSTISLVVDLVQFIEIFETVLDGVVTIFIDFTSLVMSIELFVGTIKVNNLKRKISETKAEEVAA